MILDKEQIEDLVDGNRQHEHEEMIEELDMNEAKFIFGNDDVPKTDGFVTDGGYRFNKLFVA